MINNLIFGKVPEPAMVWLSLYRSVLVMDFGIVVVVFGGYHGFIEDVSSSQLVHSSGWVWKRET